MSFSFDKRIELIDPESYANDKTMVSILVHGEDHTLGNAVSHTLTDMEGVEFAGYNVPHPLEDSIMIRVQTKKGYDAGKVLLQALDQLELIFQKIGDKFKEAHTSYRT